MTEMTQYRPATAAEITYGPDFGSELIGRAVQQMAGAAKLGEALAMTAFVPAAFRGKPDDAAAAIMYGAALGLDPMTSLRAVYVVSGTPGLYARQMVAVVISRGHKVWTVESTDQSVTVSGQRRGSDVVETVTWTYERARKAGYTSNKKYDTDPQAMLWARAAGEVARRIAPDALAGLDYSVEELQVIDHVEDVPRPRRESAAALLGSPKVEDAPEVTAEPVAVEVPMVTQQQLKKIGAAMRDLGITERVHALAYIQQAIDVEVASRSDLTREQAGRLIDALTEDLEQQHGDNAEQPELPVDGGDAA